MRSSCHLRRLCLFALSFTLMLCLSGCGGPPLERSLAEAQTAYDHQHYANAYKLLAEIIEDHPQSAEAHALMGKAALAVHDLSRATAAFRRAVAVDAQQTEARLQLARIYSAAGDTLKAQSHVDAILSKEKDHVQARLLKALILQQARDYHAAEVLLGEMIQDDTPAPEAFALLANVQLLQRKGQAALTTLETGVKRYPERIELKRRLAHLLIRGGRHQAAIEIYQGLADGYPNDEALKLNLAGLYWDTDDAEKAEETLAPLVNKADRGRQERLRLARFFLRHGSVDRADTELRQGLSAAPGDVQLRIQLADLFLQQKRFDTALATLEEGLNHKEDLLLSDSQALSNAKAWVLLLSGDAAAALAVVDGVLAEDPKQVGALATRGQILTKQGRGHEAVSIFRELLQRKPRDIDSYLHLAEAYAAAGDVDLSVKSLRDGLRLDPQNAVLRKALARAHTARKDYKAAEAQLQQVLALDPADVATQVELGDFYLALKDHSRAEREYNEVRIKAPRRPLGYLRLTRLHLQQGSPDKAVRVLADGYRRNPGRAELLEPLVTLLIQQERFADAEKIGRERIDALPAEAFSHLLLGRVMRAQKKYAQAEQAFAKAAELSPQWPQPSKQLAALEILQGRKKAAANRLKQLLEKFPQDRGIYLSLGQLYREEKQTKAARGLYEKAISSVPDFWQAEEQLARLLADDKKRKHGLDRAEKLLAGALQRHPRQVSLIDALAAVHYRKGDFGRAAEIYTRLHRSAPQDAGVNYKLALALESAGDREKAVSHLKQALAASTAFPAREKAENLLKQLEKKG